MTEIWRSLAINAGAMALVMCAWTHANAFLHMRRRWVRNVALGMMMGLGSVLSMSLSIKLQDGVFFDLRSVSVVIAGYFGGPLGGLIAAAVAGGYRYALGGPGAIPGLVGIGLASVLGQLGNVIGGVGRPVIEIGLLAVTAGLLPLVTIAMLPTATLAEAYSTFALPICALTTVGIFVCGWVLSKDREASQVRALVEAAIKNTPDFYYIKNTNSEFIAVNQGVANIAGIRAPDELVGRTDMDLVPYERAKGLIDREQNLMSGAQARVDVEERVKSPDGIERWFSTSKITLRNADGEAIGLVGLTRDVTHRRLLERELRDSSRQLAFLMNEMSVGLAMFNEDGVLTFCNQRYRTMFPSSSDARKVGTHIRDILRLVVRTGEQLNVPDDTDHWIETVVSALHGAGEQQVSLDDGRWLQISTRPTGTGSSLVVVSDISAIKESEDTLLRLSNQLKVMASTDALTGLMNRRVFDGRLRRELPQSEKDERALAMLMVDVDWFKNYNDTYGHAAGDECLREVSRILALGTPKSGFVARLGGEEFAMVLPQADEDAALSIAEALLADMRFKAMPHAGSVFGKVSVSIGLAWYGPFDVGRSPKELLGRADAALYESKHRGRDRVCIWAEEDAVGWARA